MNIFDPLTHLKAQAQRDESMDIFNTLENELKSSLQIYWEKAGKIINGGSIRLLDPPDGYYDAKNNFFSALFLYSYYRAGIVPNRRILYSAMNQCLRGMVTGCDNILDDEYKRTLETSLPENGTRFRSVLDIMVSDRVMFELSIEAFREQEKIILASIISLRALMESGYQEATEEGGIDEILPPDTILKTVHHYKTGILFTCPWAIPSVMETIDEDKKRGLNEALYNIGMGCQVMDDMADLERDIKNRHHNYVASVIYHESGAEIWERLKSEILNSEKDHKKTDILVCYTDVKNRAVDRARAYLVSGLNGLFEEEHRFLVEPVIKFLSTRIGVERYFQGVRT
ncbi:MAG: polyprenyl synthetase family protein [Deltaproteobacteria bacterium]|nr:polyprenyl synthetase family protein [Deltaproteobacteria bacterium]